MTRSAAINRRQLAMLVLSGAAWLSGCASLNAVDTEVATFNRWPAGRRPASYAFERLPSQQAQAPRQARLEALARPALETAGFTLAANPKAADVTVQIGARSNRADISPYDDPLWWRGGLYASHHGRRGYWRGSPHYFGAPPSQFDNPRYEREVALLIRDRASNDPLFEVRATNEGNTPGGDALMQIMFTAALRDFPYAGVVEPRVVRVQLP